MFETFDHTADIGLRVKASDLPALFAEAAQALTTALLGPSAEVAGSRGLSIFLEAPDLIDLMHDWLSELHFYFETEQFICARADVTVDRRWETDRKPHLVKRSTRRATKLTWK